MSGDCEPVRFVAHLLDQMQCRRCRSGVDFAHLRRKDQGLFTRPALRSLGHADDPNAANVQLHEHIDRLLHLTAPPSINNKSGATPSPCPTRSKRRRSA